MAYEVSEEELRLLRSFEDGGAAGLMGVGGDKSLNSIGALDGSSPLPRSTRAWSWRDMVTCDVCDPLSEYYEIRVQSGGKRRRSILPRLFYVVSVAQMLLLILATLSVSSRFCGFSSGPGGLQSGLESLHAGSVGGLVHAVKNKPVRELPQQHAEVHHSPTSKPLLLQTRERGMSPPRTRKAPDLRKAVPLKRSQKTVGLNAPPLEPSQKKVHTYSQMPSSPKHKVAVNVSKQNSADQTDIQRQRSSHEGPPGPTALEAVISKLHNRWSSLENSIKLHTVGEPMPLAINCGKCVAAHHSASTRLPPGTAESSTQSSWRFRPSSIVLGAMVPIFLSAAIIIIIGVMAVSNFVLAGPQRLAFYLALVMILTIFSCHFSVLQNVTSIRLRRALEMIPKDQIECRQIIAQQAADHHQSDILWGLHAVANLFSAVLSVLGLAGCDDMHDSIESD